MRKQGCITQYSDGERLCPVCNETPLPAHEVWPGAKYVTCGKLSCEAKPLHAYGTIGPNERKCEGPGCNNFVSGGKYHNRVKFFACSARCWARRSAKGSIEMICGCGCGTKFFRASERDNTTGLVFLSNDHHTRYMRDKYATESFGHFRELVEQFFAESIPGRYRNDGWIRQAIGPFFRFLRNKNVTSLADVTPLTITEYLLWARNNGTKNAAHDLSGVSSFFHWCIYKGYRMVGNPVVPRYHYPPKKQKMPRPLSPQELELVWDLLHRRGNARLRFAMAMGQESGTRISEMCNLRMEDVDLERYRFFIRLPNKSMAERWAFFSNKTKQYYLEWVRERDAACGHDYVLHNRTGAPCSTQSLREEFKRVLCKTYEGEENHKVGVDKWSTHRLRHTMASTMLSAGAEAAIMMSAGGWKSFEAMSWYAKADDEVARRGYDKAMRAFQEKKQAAPETVILTPEQLLSLDDIGDAQRQLTAESDRCV